MKSSPFKWYEKKTHEQKLPLCFYPRFLKILVGRAEYILFSQFSPARAGDESCVRHKALSPV